MYLLRQEHMSIYSKKQQVKTALTALFILLALFTIAQEKVDTYAGSFLDRKFNIRATLDSNEKPTLYLEVFNGIPGYS